MQTRGVASDERYDSRTTRSPHLHAPLGALQAAGATALPRRAIRICIVCSEFLGPFRNGGIGTAYTKLGEILSDGGHEVTFLYSHGRYSSTEPIEHWIEFYRQRGIQFVPVPESPVAISFLTDEIARSYRAYLWLKEHDGFDVVHFPDCEGPGYYTGLARREGLAFQNTITVVGLHGSSPWARFANQQLPHWEKDLERDFIERRSGELADIVWSPGHYMLDWVRQNGWDLRRERHVQPYVVSPLQDQSTGHFCTRPIRELVFFGRQETRKGLFVFLDAIDRLAAMRPREIFEGLVVTILGGRLPIEGHEGEQVVRARSQAWPFPTRVVTDHDREQAVEYLQGEGRLAVIPSIVENYPNTVLECLGFRVPFLASRVGGIPEQIHRDDVERVCFEPDPRSLAERLERAIREGHAPARLAFDPEQNSRDWVRWHEQIVEERRSAVETCEVGDDGSGASEATVSVCIAHYNRPHFLRQALDSDSRPGRKAIGSHCRRRRQPRD